MFSGRSRRERRRAAGSVCVCVSVCNALTFESKLDLESLHFSMQVPYAFRIFRSSSYINIIGSKPRSQEQKSVKSHPATPSMTDMAQSRCSCSDGKSIAVIRGMTLPAYAAMRVDADRHVQTSHC